MLSFDTSTLVAALVSNHPHHAAVWPWFERVLKKKDRGCMVASLVVLPAFLELLLEKSPRWFSVATRARTTSTTTHHASMNAPAW